MRSFVARAWYEVCGKVSEDHLKAGTSVEKVRNWLDTMKYMAKAETLTDIAEDDEPEGEKKSPGRFWGIWNKDLLHIVWETVQISPRGFFKIRRILRRLVRLKPRDTVRAMRVFRKDDVIKMILSYFGYSPP